MAGRLLPLLLAAGCASAPPAAPAAPDAPAPAPAAAATTAGTPSGLYTAAQAQRGKQVFDTVCSACHGLGEFRGRMFELTWMAAPVGDFFQHISAAMPQDRPGSLTPEQYASVVAYVLQLNGREPGERALSTDPGALADLRW